MQNTTTEQLYPGADDRCAAVMAGVPEREVVFVDSRMRSLLLWFPDGGIVNPDSDAMLRAASAASDLVTVSVHYNSGGYVMNKADGACGYTYFPRIRMEHLHRSLIRAWYEGSLVMEYCPYSEHAVTVLGYRAGRVCVDNDVRARLPRTTMAMLLANAINNGWLKDEVLMRLRQPYDPYSQAVEEEVRALEEAVMSTGVLRPRYSIDEAAALVQEQGQNFADKLNSMLVVKTNHTPNHV